MRSETPATTGRQTLLVSAVAPGRSNRPSQHVVPMVTMSTAFETVHGELSPVGAQLDGRDTAPGVMPLTKPYS